LVSSGSSGFWFFNCVVSNVRKVVKLLAIIVLSAPVAVLAVLLVLPAGVGTGVAVIVLMIVS
jgi:hypothetical protein